MPTLEHVAFDAHTVTRDLIRTVPVPAATKTYFPISHDNLIEQIEAACAQRGIEILERRYRLSRSGTQFVGSYILGGTEHVSPDFNLMLGFRNSTDKSMVAGLVSGARVIACDNGSFCGEIALERKHTRYIIRDDRPAQDLRSLEDGRRDRGPGGAAGGRCRRALRHPRERHPGDQARVRQAAPRGVPQ